MKKSNKKFINRIIIASSIALAIGLGASSVYGYSSWIFTDSQVGERNVEAFVPDWSFEGHIDLNPGDIIVINNDGTITVNGEVVDATLDFGESDSAYQGEAGGATVKMEIVVNEDGTLSITTYDLKPDAALFGSNSGTVYFPQYLSVNGESVQVTSVNEPVNFESSRVWFMDSKVNGIVLPEGYQTICNKAFYNCDLANNTTFDFPSTLTQIGSQIINVPRNSTWTINYNGTRAQWNAINKPNNWKAGQGTARVVCSDGTLNF